MGPLDSTDLTVFKRLGIKSMCLSMHLTAQRSNWPVYLSTSASVGSAGIIPLISSLHCCKEIRIVKWFFLSPYRCYFSPLRISVGGSGSPVARDGRISRPSARLPNSSGHIAGPVQCSMTGPRSIWRRTGACPSEKGWWIKYGSWHSSNGTSGHWLSVSNHKLEILSQIREKLRNPDYKAGQIRCRSVYFNIYLHFSQKRLIDIVYQSRHFLLDPLLLLFNHFGGN